MTATANFRQMAQHIGLAICGLMMRTAFGVFGILWGHHQRDCKRSVPSGDRCNRGYPFHHCLLWLHPLVIHPLTLTDMAKKKQQDGSAAVQILRGGQHLRVYGGNVHQRQF